MRSQADDFHAKLQKVFRRATKNSYDPLVNRSRERLLAKTTADEAWTHGRARHCAGTELMSSTYRQNTANCRQHTCIEQRGAII
jgi:hypothetical protein